MMDDRWHKENYVRKVGEYRPTLMLETTIPLSTLEAKAEAELGPPGHSIF
jgi:hypothetical protein